ncbi:MAG: glycosyltransferase family 39 protein [Lachnospiraceae bacterium]|nr:glycosyltransferase family 39 protein [Lachnospiraceae bacterium]
MQSKKKVKGKWGKFSWKLSVLLLLSLITMIVYGSRKVGYHVDEIYSYGLANSEYLPFMHFGEIDYGVKDWMKEYGAGESLGDLFRNLIKDFQILKECDFQLKESVIYQDYVIAQANSADTRTTTWVSGQEYRDYLAVSENNRFNYASVYYNQRGDVHPPLYYMILHTICSVFQGSFSKWFAMSVNIAALLLTLILLYKMVKEYLGGETEALVAAGAYGLSIGFMNTAVWLRMYALLTLFVVALCYVHLKIAQEDFQLRGKNRRYLFLAVVGGYMTHYYFVLYAIGVAAVFTIWILTEKKYKAAAGYVLTLAGAAVIGLCIWPYAIRHVFQGYQGTQALDVIREREFYFIKVRLLFDQIAAQVLDGTWWILLACLFAAAGIVIWKYSRKTGKGRKLPLGKGALLAVPIVLYIVVVAQIVPMLIERYVMCTFPFWILYVVLLVSFVLRELTDSRAAMLKWRKISLVLTGILLFAVNNCYRLEPSGLYHGEQELVKLPENTDCIYVLADGDWNQSAIDSTILAQCRNVGVTYLSEVGRLAEAYKYQDGDYVLVAIQKDMEVEEVLAEVSEIMGLQDLEEIEVQEGATSVRFLLSGKQ